VARSTRIPKALKPVEAGPRRGSANCRSPDRPPACRTHVGQLANSSAACIHLRVRPLTGPPSSCGTSATRLAMQASELFAELTDHEYDRLRSIPETYQLQIRDAGRPLRLERFSGSEVDLATWPSGSPSVSTCASSQAGPWSAGARRVFRTSTRTAGGACCLASTTLRGRFRQVLV